MSFGHRLQRAQSSAPPRPSLIEAGSTKLKQLAKVRSTVQVESPLMSSPGSPIPYIPISQDNSGKKSNHVKAATELQGRSKSALAVKRLEDGDEAASDEHSRVSFQAETTRNQAKKTKTRTNVVAPNLSEITALYDQEIVVDFMRFHSDEQGWNFIFEQLIMHDKGEINKYINRVTNAKREAERRLRADLDLKVVSMRFEKLRAMLGKDLAARLKLYVRSYVDEVEAEFNGEVADGNQDIFSYLAEPKTTTSMNSTSKIQQFRNRRMSTMGSFLTSARGRPTVTFQDQQSAIIEKLETLGESRDEITRKGKEIKKLAEVRVSDLTLLSYHTESESQQIKKYALCYYFPVLTLIEQVKLRQETAVYKQAKEEGKTDDDRPDPAEKSSLGFETALNLPEKHQERNRSNEKNNQRLEELAAAKKQGCSKIKVTGGVPGFPKKDEDDKYTRMYKSKSERGKLTKEQRLTIWAVREKQKFEEIGHNLNSLRQEVQGMDDQLSRLKQAFKGQPKRPKKQIKVSFLDAGKDSAEPKDGRKSIVTGFPMTYPSSDLLSDIVSADSTESMKETENTNESGFGRKKRRLTIADQDQNADSSSKLDDDSFPLQKIKLKKRKEVVMPPLKPTAMESLNPEVKGPYEKKLDRYINKRANVLSSRYGLLGKGYYHNRDSPKSHRTNIYLPTRLRKTQAAQTTLSPKRSAQSIRTVAIGSVDRGNLSPPQEAAESTQTLVPNIITHKGHSFLSRLPQPVQNIDDILNKNRPLSQAAAKHSEVNAMQRCKQIKSCYGNQSMTTSAATLLDTQPMRATLPGALGDQPLPKAEWSKISSEKASRKNSRPQSGNLSACSKRWRRASPGSATRLMERNPAILSVSKSYKYLGDRGDGHRTMGVQDMLRPSASHLAIPTHAK